MKMYVELESLNVDECRIDHGNTFDIAALKEMIDKALSEGATQVCIITDREGNVDDINAGYERDYTQEELEKLRQSMASRKITVNYNQRISLNEPLRH